MTACLSGRVFETVAEKKKVAAVGGVVTGSAGSL